MFCGLGYYAPGAAEISSEPAGFGGLHLSVVSDGGERVSAVYSAADFVGNHQFYGAIARQYDFGERMAEQ